MKNLMKSPVAFCLLYLIPAQLYAADPDLAPDAEFDKILSQDISDLTVTSVARRSQRLNDTAAAVYVITQEELRRAGIYSIPEALRLVPGLQVARRKTDQWAITSRGINNALNNKMLVMIDGRPIYTPVFSGVYWGDQSTSINDIERIEVIRGPGASLYGANAVNGVVNVITKSAEDTQGELVSATATAKGNGIYEARHGGKAGSAFYRAYGQYYDADSWYRGRAGFRFDGAAGDDGQFTLQGDAYQGEQDANATTASFSAPFTQTISTTDDVYGGNVMARWGRRLTNDSDISVQAYADHYTRNEFTANQHVSTADIQMQHNIHMSERDNFIWGTEARLNYIDIEPSIYASVLNKQDTHYIISAFAQNEYALIPDVLFFTAGSKFEYNDFTGFEVQPTARLAWHPASNQTVWTAVSRAVRTPSSIEQDVNLLGVVVPTAPFTEYRIIGNKDTRSEDLIAYEVGYRIQPSKAVSIDATAYYNVYDNLQTIGLPGVPFVGANGNFISTGLLNNLGEGRIYGFEIATSWNVTNDWKLSGSYTYLHVDLDEGSLTVPTLETSQDLSPHHQFSIQSYYNISDTVHFDNTLYYMDDIANLDAYLRYDARLAWMIQPGLEVSLIGRNIFGSHEEYPSTPQTEIDRSYIGQVLWKF